MTVSNLNSLRWLGIAFVLLLSACGGSGDSSNDNGGATISLTGTAASGLPIAGSVSVIDANGDEASVTINSDGSFTIQVSGMTAPFLLRTTHNDTAQPSQYSYSTVANVTINVTPLTSLALFIAHSQGDLSTLYNNWSSSTGMLSGAQIENARAIINANLSTRLQDAGLNAATYDFFSTVFAANGNGIDSVLDGLRISLDLSGGSFSVNDSTNTPTGFDINIDTSAIAFGNGGNNNTGGGSGNGDSYPAIGLQAGLPAQISSADISNIIGAYNVGVYRVPTGQEALIGPAILIISEAAGIRSMELTTLDGTRISRTTNDPATGPFAPFGFNIANGLISGINSFNGTDPAFNMNVRMSADGSIIGTAGGFAPLAFRNNITTYGGAVPAVFSALNGTWAGPAGDLTCQPNPLTVAIGNDGSVSYQGKLSLSCEAVTVSALWDGNDDLIYPDNGDFVLEIDSLNKGGNGPGGAILIRLDALTNPDSIAEITTYATGAAGDMNLYNPVR